MDTPKIIYAKSKYVRGSARKARPIATLIRGRMAVEAEQILDNADRRAAKDILKTLKSAMANAYQNFDIDKENLMIIDSRIDEAFTMKRARPVSRGKRHAILKRSKNITIGLKDTKS